MWWTIVALLRLVQFLWELVKIILRALSILAALILPSLIIRVRSWHGRLIACHRQMFMRVRDAWSRPITLTRMTGWQVVMLCVECVLYGGLAYLGWFLAGLAGVWRTGA